MPTNTVSDTVDTGDTVLKIRDARVTFDMSRGRARVLNDISVDIERGETFGIIGESGCGKSTFGSILMDAVEDPGIATGEINYYPDTDSDPIDILDLNARELRRVRWEDIAMVSQQSGESFNPTITIRRHFVDTFDAHNMGREEGLERAREIIRDLRLDPEQILDSYQHELSGGEKQRVLLALALIFYPEVLILDEPAAGLDLLVQHEILSLLYDIKEEYGFTMIFITHNIPMVSGFADRIAVLYAFNIVELGTTREVLVNPEHPYTRLMTQANIGLDTPIKDVRTIEGETPDPINVPAGCSFHPRCPIAQDDRCEVEEPELRSDEASHEVACFYPDLATERIPARTAGMDEEENHE